MQQRGSKVLDADLLWLMTEAAGELGLRAMPLEPSIGGDNEGPSDRSVDAATKHRRITSALYSLPHEQQRVLKLAHTPPPPGRPRQLVKLGELGAVILDVDDPTWVFQALSIVAQRGKHRQDRTAIAEHFLADLKMRAERGVTVAVTAYRKRRDEMKAEEKTLRQRRHEERMRALRAA